MSLQYQDKCFVCNTIWCRTEINFLSRCLQQWLAFVRRKLLFLWS